MWGINQVANTIAYFRPAYLFSVEGLNTWLRKGSFFPAQILPHVEQSSLASVEAQRASSFET